MADLVSVDTAFGDGLTILHETVKHVVGKVFKSVLERLESTLEGVEPVVREITELSLALNFPEKETKSLIEQMKKGRELVLKCSKIKRWSLNYVFKAHSYKNKLSKLNLAIEKFFWVNFTVHSTKTVLETLAQVSQKSVSMETTVLETLAQVSQKSVSMDLALKDVEKKYGMRTLSCTVPKLRDYIVGFDLLLKELKRELLKEEVSVLIVTALGGCGKTTLVKMLVWDEEILGIYMENIFFVNVSPIPNLKIIAQKLFSHTGDECPEFQSDEEVINHLEQLLNKIGPTPILLILDDVGPESESLIEKFKFNIPNYKIVVTSRKAFPRFEFTFKLNPLDHEDAMRLFCHSASLQDVSSYSLEEGMEKIVRGCGGLPIALKVIGSSLRGQPVEVWQSTLMRWSGGHSIFDFDNEVLACLQKSLEFSADKIILKEYFMDLGSFPEDQRIPATALIDMWTELHEPSQNDVYAIVNLHELNSWNLVSLVMTRKEASVVNNYYNEDFVTQHNLLRDLAIHLSSQEPIIERTRLFVDISGNNLPDWWMKPQLINARLLSITTDELFSSSWCNIQAPEVEALILNFRTRNYTLPEFVKKMDKLKVIIVTNHNFYPSELSNFQLLNSLPNLKKIRLERVSISSLFNTVVSLRRLKKISLFLCNFGQAFGKSTIQVSDSFPNLMEINIAYCNDLVELPPWFCEFLHLKELNITNCHKLFELPVGIGKLVNLKVLRLRSCTELSKLPESITSLHKLCILDISECLSIKKLPKHIGELHNLKELHMKGCLKLQKEFPPSIIDLMQLRLVVCDEERAKLWEPFKEFFPNLRVMVAKKDINLNWLPKSESWFILKDFVLLVNDVKRVMGFVNESTTLVKKFSGGKLELDVISVDDVVGFINESTTLVKELTEGKLELDVISIVGMGGLGKTTLAKKVYNNVHVKAHFHCCVWVYVSQDFRFKELLIEILKSEMRTSEFKFHPIQDLLPEKMTLEDMHEEDLEDMDEKFLIDILHEYLSRKKYLVVLDDVWTTEAWDEVKIAFPINFNGSRILITSREKEVALHASGGTPPYHPPFLDKDDSWELLRKQVFLSGECPHELEELGKQIAKSCYGLPLSIVVMGGLLAKEEKEKTKWEEYISPANWNPTRPKSSRCKDILDLSYNHLPLHLKPCFLYFGIYPEDYEIPVRQLIQLWIAEGFIENTGDRILEDVAEDYLKELIDRSLIQVASRRTDRGAKTCRIHDLLRDFCISKSEEEKLFVVRKDVKILSSDRSRRLSILCSAPLYMSSNHTEPSGARSLFFFDKDYPSLLKKSCWEWVRRNFELVQVLHFGKVNPYIIPDYIENFTHLKYLRIDDELAYCVPDSICNLWTLETLVANNGSKVICLPVGIWKLQHLRNLYMSAAMTFCGNTDVEALQSLQVLSTVVVDPQTASVIIKGKLPNVRKLGIRMGRNESNRKDFFKLPKGEYWESGETLESLCDLRHLQTLKITDCSKLPSGANSLPQSITKITLIRVDLNSMAVLGSLRKLRVLKLKHCSFEVNLNFTRDLFPELVVLKLDELSMTEWGLERGALPQLKHLVIKNCTSLTMLPEELCNMTSLPDVEVLWTTLKLAQMLQKLQKKVGFNLQIYPSLGDNHYKTYQ